MKKASIIIFICVFLLLSCIACNEIQERYYGIKANWQCSDEEFENYYVPSYEKEILRLKEVYNLDCEYRSERYLSEHGYLKYTFYLYSEDFTVEMVSGASGYYDIVVYYFSEKRLEEDYACIKPLAEFSNDITNFMAFDTVTETNQFEVLYNKAKSSDKKYATNYYHFDNSVGNVGYYVSLNDLDCGYYYLANKDSSVEKPCHRMIFEGLLKTRQ